MRCHGSHCGRVCSELGSLFQNIRSFVNVGMGSKSFVVMESAGSNVYVGWFVSFRSFHSAGVGSPTMIKISGFKSNASIFRGASGPVCIIAS